MYSELFTRPFLESRIRKKSKQSNAIMELFNITE